MNAAQLIEQVAAGADPTLVAKKAIDEGISGPERQDLTPEQQAEMFQQLIAQSEAQVPYLNKDYVDMVLGQLRQGAPAQEMISLAASNRDQYATDHNLGDSDFATWDAIHRSLVKTYTDEVPPNSGA